MSRAPKALVKSPATRAATTGRGATVVGVAAPPAGTALVTGPRLAGSSSSVGTWLATRSPAPLTLDEAIGRLQAIDDHLTATHDRRAVFVETYLMQVRSFAADVKIPGRYDDPAWITRMTLNFVQRYLDAYDAYDRGDLASVPEPWRLAFDSARDNGRPVVGDLVLAMNAHINHDLPLCLADMHAGPDNEADFLRFNEVLERNVDPVKQSVMQRFMRPQGSIASSVDRFFGPVDTWQVGNLIRSWRDAAWQNGQALETRGQRAYPAILSRSGWRARLVSSLAGLTPASWGKLGLL